MVRSGMVEIPPIRLTIVRLINNFQILEVEELPDKNGNPSLRSPRLIFKEDEAHVRLSRFRGARGSSQFFLRYNNKTFNPNRVTKGWDFHSLYRHGKTPAW